MTKRVLLIIVDALTSRTVIPAMERGELPTFAALARAGALHPGCVSMFPSITPAATATILTGHYPDRHGIAGASWYDDAADRMIYYSDDVWTILREGLSAFCEDFLTQLNHDRLQVPTIFTLVERAGLQAASLNNLIYRGDVKHTLKPPLLLRLLPGMPSHKTVAGPTGLLLGDFAAEGFATADPLPQQARGPKHRFGFDDAHTSEALLHLARNDALPALTVAYFPDNDFHSHQVGPETALSTVQQVDAYLGELVAALGGLDQLLEAYCLVITGDHSHAAISDDEQAGVTLDALLPEHQVAASGASWGAGDDVLIALNLRAAQIYLRRPTVAEAERVAAALLRDERIDQLFWRECDVGRAGPGYMALTADRGRLRFWPGDDGPVCARDVYGQSWCWEGDLAVVDGRIDTAGRLHFGAYPNAFERLATGLGHEGAGPLWVTARPGYSFHLTSTTGIEIHAGGGSHGALHADDSLVPLIVAGIPSGIELPAHPRTVDITPLCLAVLNLLPDMPVGAGRVIG